ncbi:GAF and ANTAR domain-containing protein [Arthrobacter sp. Br18]|uniref:GAF and ANTAR domain-containing protein n=1 Tax=Arthrobacter sp. Br18 TaxID=1312954 RepID=UPI00047E7DD0|nr:GAF and ANTAR domain-containing protein [Arthrobacter sp. Br18]
MTEMNGGGSVAGQLQHLLLASDNIHLFLESFAVHTSKILEPAVTVMCGVTLKQRNRATTVASSSMEAKVLDEVQYGYGDGPCLDAVRTGSTNVIQDARTDTRWRDYLSAISDRGYFSALGVPLMRDDDGGAAVNLYAKEPGAFTPEVVEQVQEYAAEASIALQLALQLSKYQDAAANLKSAMESRTNIDIAVGIIIAQNRCSQIEAIEILRKASSHRNVKLRVVAGDIVRSATGGAVETHFAT